MRDPENIQLEKEKPFYFINGFNSANYSARISKSKLENRTYLDNKTTTEHQKDKKQCLSKSERLAKKGKTKKRLVNLLEKVGETDLSERVKICGQKWSVISCGTHVISRRPNHSCNARLCPFCAPKRSRKIQKKYLPIISEFLKVGKKATPCHLTLTQTHRKNETLKESRKRLMNSFKKLQRRDFWQRHFRGGLYAFESTLTDTGHHAHLHILAFRTRFFDVSILRAEWLEITGDSHVLRLDRITDISSGLREVVKYVSKPIDIERYTPKNLLEMLELKGARLFGTFGTFARFCRAFDASDIDGKDEAENGSNYCEGDCCPICENPLFETVLTFQELVKFIKKIEAVPKMRS
jgi:hypothetical protein